MSGLAAEAVKLYIRVGVGAAGVLFSTIVGVNLRQNLPGATTISTPKALLEITSGFVVGGTLLAYALKNAPYPSSEEEKKAAAKAWKAVPPTALLAACITTSAIDLALVKETTN